MSLFAELNRRNVIRMAGLYLVAAWLMVQAAETVLPAFDVPGWVLRAIIILLALGFIPALIFSWVFELTPDGLKRDAEVDPQQSISGQTAQRMDRLIFVGLAVLIALVAWDRLSRDPVPTVAPAREAPGADPAAVQLRLAVLPLANFSPDPDNAFFADGLHDDLLTALSRLKGMEVISRTTMQTFKGSSQKLAEIASELGATHVIEGSVRRDASQVRLTIQLIDPRNDAHLWAENYDRPLSDALTLQAAVAGEVAGALQLAITGGTEAPATSVPAAYDLFLRARLMPGEMERYRLLDSALLLDPGFTQARAERAIAAAYRIWFNDSDAAALAAQARADIDQARSERPGLLEVQLAEAYYVYYVQRDYASALQLAEKAVQTAPNEVRALHAYALLLRRNGRLDEAIAISRRALQLDPADPNAHFGVVDMLVFADPRSREAIAIADAAIARFPRAQTERLRLYRLLALSALTGAPMTRAVLLADGISEREADMFFGFAPADRPTMQSLARLEASQDEWCNIAPCAVWLAREAQYLGEEAILRQALGAADRTYAAAEARPDPMRRDLDHDTGYALYLALSGAPGGQVLSLVEQTLARARVTEALDVYFFTIMLAKALAAAGERAQALALFESLMPDKGWLATAMYHDPYLQRWMQGDPGFEALRARIAESFEPL
ncbi:MAG TPA: CDC27 family protein [Lysobacter sp.]|nr:CDC27 family protein [Lysobacter sp.]